MASNHQGGMLERARKVWNTFNSFFFGGKELDQILSCTMCEKQFRPHHKTPLRLVFCSFECYFNFIRSHKTNNQLCLMPGCYKDRSYDYWSNTWYDHCGREHAGIHREQIREIYSGYRPITSTSMCDYYLSVNTTIFFYEKDQPFYEFMNFANYPIIVDDFCYHSTEHYFQSQKLAGTPYEQYVALLPRARNAFEFPCQPEVSIWVRRDWDKVKEDVMFKALYHKFTQYPELKKLLLRTGDQILVKDSPDNSYWGSGRDKRGRNRLGVLLMRLRQVLKGEPIHITNHSRVSTDGNKASCTQRNDKDSQGTGNGDHLNSLTSITDNERNRNNDCKTEPVLETRCTLVPDQTLLAQFGSFNVRHPMVHSGLPPHKPSIDGTISLEEGQGHCTEDEECLLDKNQVLNIGDNFDRENIDFEDMDVKI